MEKFFVVLNLNFDFNIFIGLNMFKLGIYYFIGKVIGDG